MGVGPTVSMDLAASWGAELKDDDDDDDMEALVRAHRSKPMDLSEDKIDAILADLPEDWVGNRDRSLEVGQAISHQFGGSDEGYSKWCEWSTQSNRLQDRGLRAALEKLPRRQEPGHLSVAHPGGRTGPDGARPGLR